MTFVVRSLFVVAITVVAFVSYSFTNPNSSKSEEDTPKEKIQWMSWEEAIEKNKTNPKKIFVDVYTDWCGWCKRMDASTFKDKKVVSYMNKHFYAVKFDAESKKDIVFDGHTFKFINNGRRGYHALAASLLDNRLSFPSFVALDEEVRRITIIPGYQKANDFVPMLRYIGENHYKNTTYKDYLSKNK